VLGDSIERDNDKFRKPAIEAMIGLASLNARSKSCFLAGDDWQ